MNKNYSYNPIVFVLLCFVLSKGNGLISLSGTNRKYLTISNSKMDHLLQEPWGQNKPKSVLKHANEHNQAAKNTFIIYTFDPRFCNDL